MTTAAVFVAVPRERRTDAVRGGLAWALARPAVRLLTSSALREATLLPTPDFRGLFVLLLATMSVPLLLGAIATILASSAGAEDVVQLSRARHFLATVIGSLVGWLGLTGLLGIGLFFIANLGELFLLVLLASVCGGLVGFQSAKLVSCRLNWYTCKTCGLRFRSQFVRRECAPCMKELDRVAVQGASAASSTHTREL